MSSEENKTEALTVTSIHIEELEEEVDAEKEAKKGRGKRLEESFV